MKLLFDQNISYKILKKIPDSFKNSSHIKYENLINATDLEIWNYARSNEFTIVTFDADFDDLRLLHGFPPKIIWIRTGNISNNHIVKLLENYQFDIFDFINDTESGCLEITKSIT